MKYIIPSLTLLSILFIISCTYPGYFEKNTSISNMQWNTKDIKNYEFDITDTSAQYNVYVAIKHLDTYHYNNIWLDITTIAPRDTAKTQKLNLKLGNNKKWLGSIADDIVDHRILITQSPIQLRQGKYTFILKNAMREDPLENVMSVGIRVEKVLSN